MLEFNYYYLLFRYPFVSLIEFPIAISTWLFLPITGIKTTVNEIYHLSRAIYKQSAQFS